MDWTFKVGDRVAVNNQLSEQGRVFLTPGDEGVVMELGCSPGMEGRVLVRFDLEGEEIEFALLPSEICINPFVGGAWEVWKTGETLPKTRPCSICGESDDQECGHFDLSVWVKSGLEVVPNYWEPDLLLKMGYRGLV